MNKTVSLAGNIIGWVLFLFVVATIVGAVLVPVLGVIVFGLLMPFALSYEIIQHT